MFCVLVQFLSCTECWGSFSHGVSRARWVCLGLLFPSRFVAVVSNCVLGHCVFVVSHFLLWSAFEFPMAMLGVLFLIHCGLWIVSIIHFEFVAVDAP